ncbi:MAG: hypothetical protein K0R51_333 [Cytophagaceae bacterium]|jgi:hypothetical protein|nr:hypothetical protein [Cytophagaceae bacterium]
MNQQALEDLKEIRSIMDRSTRFISLSGISGIIAGVSALAGAAVAYWYFQEVIFNAESADYWNQDAQYRFFLLDALAVLIVAVSGGIFFTVRKAKSQGQKIWDSTSRRLLINLCIPLAVGGYFCAVLLYMGFIGFIAPVTLTFYGLALLNASKYTLDDIRYLAISELILGMVALWFIGYGLLFWSIGFGVLHIVYGSVMYFKYEK